MYRQPIFFLHNPKAGGSSLRALFGRLFEPEDIAPVFSNAPNDHRTNYHKIGNNRGFMFYAGHYGYQAYRVLRRDHHLITNFRDPVDRIASMYRYWRHQVREEDIAYADPGDADLVRLAKQLDFSAFIRVQDPDLALYISDFHARQLVHSSWAHKDLGTWDRLLIKFRVLRMPWIFVAELPDESSRLLGRWMPRLASHSIPRENVTQGDKLRVEPADRTYLENINRADYDIYRFAVRVQKLRYGRLIGRRLLHGIALAALPWTASLDATPFGSLAF